MPFRAAEPAVSHGETLFVQNCYKCHPGAEGGLAPAIADKPFPDFLKRFQIRHGLGSSAGVFKTTAGRRRREGNSRVRSGAAEYPAAPAERREAKGQGRRGRTSDSAVSSQ